MGKYIVIIQARMGSSRLPGKSLKVIKGKPMLEHIVDGVESVFSKECIYVATSKEEQNQVIVDFCKRRDIGVLQGNEHNVASRYLEILKRELLCDYFFRICGDTP